jgi:hypothetical protein
MDKQAQLKALAKRMKPMHVRMAIALGEGKKQHESYTIAGGTGKDPIKCATGLIKTNPDISIYAELSKECVVEEARERGVWDMQKKTGLLEEWMGKLSAADGDKGMLDAANAIKAMAEHNRMTGDLAAIKTDNKTAIDLSGLSDAQLEAMANE